jgi:prepilin-type processing-associated H-X9-DG protein
MATLSETSRRPALSLIELLVITAIIAVLAGLVLPAVQKAREAAVRTRCQNNLKQIGLAAHAYHAATQALPASYIRQDWPTWAVLILPYIEQQAAYSAWDTQLRYYEQPTRGTAADPTAQAVPIYFCPARRGPDVGLSVATGDTVSTQDVPSHPQYGSATHRPGGLSDYAACNGTTGNLIGDGAMVIGIVKAALKPDGTPWKPVSNLSASPPGTKITNWKGRIGLADITDGTSTTLLIGEKHVRPENRWGKNEDRSVYNGSWLDSFLRMAGKSGKHPPVPVFPLVTDPNDDWDSQTPIRPSYKRFGGTHPGACQFAFCDGSVRPVSNGVDEITLGRLAGRADGEPIGNEY